MMKPIHDAFSDTIQKDSISSNISNDRARDRREPADEAPKKVTIEKYPSLSSIDQTDVEPFKVLGKHQL